MRTNAFAFLLSLLVGAMGVSVTHAQPTLDWVGRFSGPSNVIERAQAAVGDPEGHLYITGQADANGPLLGGDIVTVKFDPAGNLVWTARYGSPGRLIDGPTAMARDGEGNLYVTGYSYTNPSNVVAQNIVTLKYNAAGTQLWAALWSGPTNNHLYGSSIDYPRAITVDSQGNVIVVGSTGGLDANDYAIIKYDPAGQQLWAFTYDSPNHGNDWAQAVTVNTAGEVYVAGSAGVIKYAANGTRLWVAPVPAAAVALDPEENVVVAVNTALNSDEGADYYVLKLNPAGNYLWGTTYDGVLGRNDVITHLYVDAAGNVFVTGTSEWYCHWERDPDGGEEEICDVVMVTMKLDPQGQILWVARYGNSGPEAETFPASFEVDAAGNVYVLGVSSYFSTAVLLKYDPLGTRVWTTQYRDPNHGWDTPEALVLSTNQSLYVAGSSHWRDGQSSDYFALKYTDALTPNLPTILVPPTDAAVAMGSNQVFRVEAAGLGPLNYQWLWNGASIPDATNALLAITAAQFTNAGDYSVRVSNNEGPVLSREARLTVRSPLTFAEGPRTIAVIEGVTVALEFQPLEYGTSYQWLYNGTALPGANEYRLVMTNALATQAGVYTLRASNSISQVVSPPIRLVVSTSARQCLDVAGKPGLGTRFSHGGLLRLGPGGSVYTAGNEIGVTKYDAAGNSLWSTPYNGEVAGLVVDANGNAYLTGYNHQNSDDFLTVKYSTNGTVEWSRIYNGPANGTDRAVDIALDQAGNIIVAGWGFGLTGGTGYSHPDYVIQKYSPSGQLLWQRTYDGPDHLQDTLHGLTIDAQDNIYVTGSSLAEGFNNWNCATLKFSANGALLWTAIYQPIGGGGWGNDLAVTPQGEVYVAGLQSGVYSGQDAFLVKYDAAGQQIWLVDYNIQGRNIETFNRLALDHTGNILVAGAALSWYGNMSSTLLAKYDSQGNRLWMARYDRGTQARPADLVVDAQGNAYLLSRSETDSRSTFATLMFDPQGTRLWEAMYHSSLHSIPGSMARSEAGDIYVVGGVGVGYNENPGRLVWVKYCRGTIPAGQPVITMPPRDQIVGVGSNIEFSVTATGDQPMWYRWSSGQTNSTLSLTNVQPWQSQFLTVEVCNQWGCVVSPAASLEVYAQPGIDVPLESQTVILGGRAEFIVVPWQFSLGKIQWSHNGVAIPGAVFTNLVINNVQPEHAGLYTVSVSNPLGVAEATAQLRIYGDVQSAWEAASGQTNYALPAANVSCVDAAGNIYVAGTVQPYNAYTDDIITLKFSPAGEQLWVARYTNPPGTINDRYAVGVRADTNGNVYVAVNDRNQGSAQLPFLIKYSPTGEKLWSRLDAGFATGQVCALELDYAGNPYVCGQLAGAGVVIGTRADGSPLLTANCCSTNSGGQVLFKAFTFDTLGNIVATGQEIVQDQPSRRFLGILTAKISPAGQAVWTALYPGRPEGVNLGGAIAMDAGGNVWIAGNVRAGENTDSLVALKYNPAGQLLWDRLQADYFQMPWGNDQLVAVTRPVALRITPENTALVSGYFRQFFAAEPWRDLAVAKLFHLDANGGLLFTAKTLPVASYEYYHAGIVLDEQGNSYLAAAVPQQLVQNAPADVTAFKFDAAGQMVWHASIGASGTPLVDAAGIHRDNQGNLFVIGNEGTNIVVRSYSQLPLPEAPVITSVVAPEVLYAGMPLVLSATASNTNPAIQARWQFNGQTLSESAGLALDIGPAHLTNSGVYRVIVQNDTHQVSSPPVRVQVITGPQFAMPQVDPQGISVSFLGVPEVPVVVEASSNLKDWTPVATNSVVPGNTLLNLPYDPQAPGRFFRLRGAQ